MSNIFGNQSTTIERSQQEIDSEDVELNALRKLAQEQQAKLNDFGQRPEVINSSTPINPSVKASMPNSYGKAISERNNVSLRSLFRLQKSREFSNTTGKNLLSLALCHLSGIAATWAMRPERDDNKPTLVEELRRVMFKQFVPSVEKQQAKQELISLRWQHGLEMNKHIEKFE